MQVTTYMMRSSICRTRTVLSRRITIPDSTGLKVLSSRGMLLGQSVLFWLLEPWWVTHNTTWRTKSAAQHSTA